MMTCIRNLIDDQKYTQKNLSRNWKKAFLDLKSKYSSNLRKHYLSFLELMTVLRKHPIQKKIIKTAKRLREDEDYDYDESIQYAVKKRRFLIDKNT